MSAKYMLLIKLKIRSPVYYLSEKNTLLALILINIYGPLFTLRNRYNYFFKIVDNYLKKYK